MKNKQNNKKSKKGGSKLSPRAALWLTCAAIGVAAMAVVAAWFYFGVCGVGYDGKENVRVYIARGATGQSIRDSLTSRLGDDFGSRVARLLSLTHADPRIAEGSYVVKPGDEAKDVARRIRTGAQDPVKLTFNNIRTIDQLAERIASRLELKAGDFLAACDSVLPARGYSAPQYTAAFLPDTYEFYWNEKPEKLVTKLADVRDGWWTAPRTEAAKALGLTKVEVATLASIVEEETAKTDEKPMVARLYLNRLSKGMRLQADPTVKFAVGDFSLRRITGEHLGIDSPYNTYRHEGLPPGPIRIAEPATMESVLHAPAHDYIYMCAKEDFSGYHNFAVSGAEHMANARRYHDALNRRGIH